MRKLFSTGCVSLLLATSFIAGTANAQQNRKGESIAGVTRPAPTNAAGQVLLSESGAQIRYKKSEWKHPAQAAAVLSTGAKTQAPGSSAVTPSSADWSYVSLGSGIGMSGLLTAVNGSRTEIYAGGSSSTFGDNDYWYALQRKGKSFQQLFASEYFPQGIRSMVLARVAGAASNIAVGLGDGTVVQYDQPTKIKNAAVASPCTGHGGLQTLITADLNADGTDEFIASCSNSRLVVYGVGSSYAGWSLAGAGGSRLVAAQMDNDAAIEIASTNGRVVDTNTKTVQWNNTDGFGSYLQAADIDNDGRAELIAAQDWNIIWAYDIERQLPKWSIPVFDIDAILVTDIDNDGVQELIVGDGQWGDVHAYDTVTLAQEWAISNPGSGATNIAVADVDGDGVNDVFWAAGADSTGADYLYMGNWQTQAIKAESEHLDGPFIGPQIGDLDGDGVNEIVAVSFTSESGYDSGRIVVIDSVSRKVRAISTGVAGGDNAWTGVHDVKLRDINGDGRPEILVATDWLYDGVIEAYSFSADNKFTLVWSNASRPDGAPFHSVEVADVDGDGTPEIIGGVGREHTGAAGVFIYAYNIATRAEKWHTLQMGNYWSAITDLAIVDTDNDGDMDIVGMVEGGNVYVFDGPTHQLGAIITTTGASVDTRGQGAGLKIVIGNTTGRMSLHAFNGTTYPEVSGTQYGAVPLDGLHKIGTSFWVGSDGHLSRYDNGSKTYETTDYGSGFGTGLISAPGRKWMYSAGAIGVHGFKTAP